jgi:hypothetical protein
LDRTTAIRPSIRYAIQLSLVRNPDPECGVSGLLLQSLELLLVRELAGEIDVRMSRSQHYGIHEQAIV